MGYYASLAELRSAVPSPAVGDAYGVGASEPYEIYIWGDNLLYSAKIRQINIDGKRRI